MAPRPLKRTDNQRLLRRAMHITVRTIAAIKRRVDNNQGLAVRDLGRSQLLECRARIRARPAQDCSMLDNHDPG
jgi:hypothetical protein